MGEREPRRLLWIGVTCTLVALVIGFGSGLLVGRQFPAHHYEKFGNTSYLLDVAPGKVCDPMFKTTGPPPPGFTIVPIEDANPPACGK